MRILVTLALLGFSVSTARAQDPGQMAAQQAMQDAQAANQIAQQQMQQATQLATQNAMNNAATASSTWGCCQLAATPRFSVKPGAYPGATTVKIHDATRGATIYYTTDGWTPTANSKVYTGPLTIDSTMTLQAVAIAPHCSRSLIAVGTYTLPTGPAILPSVVETATQTSGGPLLASGTPVPLVFAQDVNSKTADVGDKIQLSLDADIVSGGTVIVPKGASAAAVITQVDHTGAGGLPGEIAFKVDSLMVNGTVIVLRGSAAKEGQIRLPNAAVMIPVVGPFTLLKHGKDAVITKGTPFVAYVNADTTLAVSRPD